MCAMVAGRTSTALGAAYRRISYRIGKPKAITATARKLAILVYCTLKGDMDYKDPGAEAYEEQHRAKTPQNLRNRARQLGFGLVSVDTGELLQGPVSSETERKGRRINDLLIRRPFPFTRISRRVVLSEVCGDTGGHAASYASHVLRELVAAQETMPLKHGQHFNRIEHAAVHDPVAIDDELAKAATGDFRELATSIRIPSKRVTPSDQFVDEPHRRLGMVTHDERLDLGQALPRPLGPDDLHPLARSVRHARRRFLSSAVPITFPASASARPAAIDSRNRCRS